MNPQSLQENIIYLCAYLTRRFNQRMQQGFKAAGFDITSEQFTILTHLWYENGLTQQEIANRTDRDKTTVSRVVRNMIKGKLVAKEIHPNDSRSYMIKLTPYGRRIQDQLITISGSLFHQTLNDLDPNLIQGSVQALNGMINNLD